MEASKDISRLIEIMEALRQPETGCPWDVVQTFETIKPYTIEEAYEVADAIERKDMDDLCEELGDLLLQVVFHARIAEELGEFAFGDVVQAVTAKMIRRHPHVFAVSDADTPDGVKLQWDRIKAEEKRERAERRARRGITEDFKAGFLGGVQRSQPALTEALKLQEQAARAGFDWSNPAPILDKIEEEIAELREALAEGKPEKVSDELGDLIFALVNIGRHVKADPEDALRGTNTKFRRRFNHIETSLTQNGETLEEASLERMEDLWQAAKRIERSLDTVSS
ncbi:MULTISPECIES: nucleoside triphosphate pyrophosphohydrolase [Agrobacterium]|uniref:Nucleoside triphosphate pyrophosphohydrolase n=1 Tax=Agrobacterium salinitolerans TaxID=1183413 RepID=A0A4Z1QYT9_9HYPH|nr:MULTISPECIES: nucleoside triphosphate pyrophosphohydrolase [Agrobacterium]MCZ7886545.1 nucleoside triphosphate pyrophosphohydrolase [Agrobacterium salinitolerans]MDA5629118.1 nucleoside triphosphate pyrophosphohydrolase [Agrobacterium sp. ST15.16.055]MDA6979795.1 nucleoside triphosphate pyrophosphohydrolase [Agrobacterium salinitolerans]NTA37046.1 nucleoside triphosphate pyrophosphohydrolase [Agrobacterium salinitolerans]QXC51779.1 nucleoside triphosphate pyrophosphohydrolase [Agrobacterium